MPQLNGNHQCKCDFPGHCPWNNTIVTKEQYVACKEGRVPEATDPAPCLYLGKLTDQTIRKIQDPIYECKLHGCCTLKINYGRRASCEGCRDHLTKDSKDLPSKFIDPLRITDRSGKATEVLRNMLKGRSAFLVCGGPSINALDYAKLRNRGVFSLGINNVAAQVPVAAFVCSDPPIKFHDGVFLDPKIMKFIPTPKFSGNRSKLRTKKQDGTFEPRSERVTDCPNVWGFERRSWLSSDATWFTETSAAWGNQAQGLKKFGLGDEHKTANTMFLGLRILQYLGARRIFLLGVDFHMDPARGLHENYSFGEQRNEDAIKSNNRQYAVAARWFKELVPVFKQFGFEVYNCNPTSQLRAFEYVPFEVALKDCLKGFPPEPWNLENWYKK